MIYKLTNNNSQQELFFNSSMEVINYLRNTILTNTIVFQTRIIQSVIGEFEQTGFYNLNTDKCLLSLKYLDVMHALVKPSHTIHTENNSYTIDVVRCQEVI